MGKSALVDLRAIESRLDIVVVLIVTTHQLVLMLLIKSKQGYSGQEG